MYCSFTKQDLHKYQSSCVSVNMNDLWINLFVSNVRNEAQRPKGDFFILYIFYIIFQCAHLEPV